MKRIQDALRPTGIPAYATAWKPTRTAEKAPDKYLVYTVMRTEDHHYDDAPVWYRLYVYLNLWTKGDPTADALRVRAAMREAGFAMQDETDSYNDETDQTLVAWTWIGSEEVEPCP